MRKTAEERMAETITDPYERLAFAIIVQAVKDYRHYKKKLAEDPYDTKAIKEFASAKSFLKSKWCYYIGGIHPDILMRAAERKNP